MSNTNRDKIRLRHFIMASLFSTLCVVLALDVNEIKIKFI